MVPMLVDDSERTSQVRLAEILGALSHALDMTEGQPRGHCIRSCWIGVHVGRRMGLPEAQVWELYYTVLLKDLGCSSNAARLCELYMADDLSLKRDFKFVGDGLPQVLGFVLSHTGLKANMAERFRAVFNILRHGPRLVTEVIETRCQRGADIARKLRFSDAVADAIHSLDEHWDGAGRPHGLKGPSIPLYSRIALLAQVVDVFHHSGGREAAVREVTRRAEAWFDPGVVRAFMDVARDDGFWESLGSEDIEDLVFGLEPAQRVQTVDEDHLDDIARSFALVVDAKTPFTAGHSERVSLYADMIAEEMGISPARRRWIRRAALLHDIGKLGVSNSILDKPGKLDELEWEAMRSHSAKSEVILGRIEAFAGMERVGGDHHERLDGKGYPRGIPAADISLETRIVTCADVFDALTADRPYRAAMPTSTAFEIMTKDVGTAFDPVCFAALGHAISKAAEYEGDGADEDGFGSALVASALAA